MTEFNRYLTKWYRVQYINLGNQIKLFVSTVDYVEFLF